MTGTTGYLAAIEANAVEISYGIEATWGTAPATTFNKLRLTGESLSGKKNRQRPNEIRLDAQSTGASTVSEGADGQINFALSYGTFDDPFASLMNNDWAGTLTITGSAGDIVFTNSTNRITSTTSGKFSGVVVGRWLKVAGCSASSGANNGWVRVSAKPDNQTLTVTGKTLVDETPSGSSCTLKSAGMLRNSNTFKSLFLQKGLASNLFLNYPGSQMTGLSLNFAQGKYVEGSFTVASKVETKATSDSSTGGLVAAPTGDIMDTVNNMTALQLDGTAITGMVQSIQLNVTKQGAGADYGVTSAAAQGMRIGAFELSGTFEIGFLDFTFYDRFKSETAGLLSWRSVDNQGNAYVWTLPSFRIMNPNVVAGGPNQPVIARFSLEGNPDATTGCTLQIDRFV